MERQKTKKPSKRDREREEINSLNARIEELEGTTDLKKFSDLPISSKTIDGLTDSKFVEMTKIQRETIFLALKGKDVLGAAKTGSGKTLAFLIPILENLFRNGWSQHDGLGAIIISPTRELALQIFNVLRKIGSKHMFSAGLVIGGKDLKEEKERISRMNILVCTPGRLLQHMDQTAGFDTDNLQLLVLDEADRILDMGFATTLNAIIDNLPPSRQTLLFSATQTKSVKDLARLSLSSPEYVSVDEAAAHSTPSKLQQHYMVVNLTQKIDVLYSFIKTHLQSKAIIFLSSCKQVRYVYEVYCKLQPGVPLMCLHGKQKQLKRIAIFNDFCKKKHAFLFATDIASRGLDFPAVDWVVQLDCPEDAETYIHRVGRTARFDSKGKALMFLTPFEEKGMIKTLQAKNVPIERIKFNESKITSIKNHMESLCSSNPEIKYLAQKAFISYVRSIHLQRNKEVFDATTIPFEEYAHSLGLFNTPKVKFVKNTEKNKPRVQLEESEKNNQLEESENEETEELEKDTATHDLKVKKHSVKLEKMFQKKNMNVLSEHYNKLREAKEESDDEMFVMKRKDHDIEEKPLGPSEHLSRRDMLKTKQKYKLKTMPSNSRKVFDEEGNAKNVFELESETAFLESNDVHQMASARLEQSAIEMSQVDLVDKKIQKEKLRAKKLARKLRQKQTEQYEIDNDNDDDNDHDNDNDNGFESEQSEQSDEESEEEFVLKRKDYSDEEDDFPSMKRTLEDEEELALRLMNK